MWHHWLLVQDPGKPHVALHIKLSFISLKHVNANKSKQRIKHTKTVTTLQHVTTAQWKCMRLHAIKNHHMRLWNIKPRLRQTGSKHLSPCRSLGSLSDVLIGQLRVYIFSSPSVKVKEMSVDDNILRILSPSQVLTEIYWNTFISCSLHKPKIVGFINVWKGLSSFHPVHFVQGQLHQSAYLIFVHFWTPASGRKVELCWVPLLARESARGSRGIESCFFLMQMWLQQVYLPDEMNGPFIFVHQSSWMRGRSTYLSTHSGEMVT